MIDPKPQDLNRKNLIDVSTALKGIEHFVFFGTLLGLVRDGDIIPHDDDVDFYAPIEQRDALIERLKATDFIIEEGVPNHTDYFLQAYRLIDGVTTYVDFYLYQTDLIEGFIVDRWNYRGWLEDESTHLHIPKSLIYPLKTARFFDCDIAMPAQGDALCAFLYGADWRTPLRKNTEYSVRIDNNTPHCYALTEVPKRIYGLWMQGEENAPELVKCNWQRWKRLNPEYELIILDKESSLTYLTDFPFDVSTLPMQAYSDILRLTLLMRYGGIWTDATVFPVKPLSQWLPEAMGENSFFAQAYSEDFLKPQRPIGPWFLAATVDSLIMKKWYDLTCAYWFMPRSLIPENAGHVVPKDPSAAMRLDDLAPTPHYPYYWPHHLFAHLLKTNPDFADMWAEQEKTRLTTFETVHAVQFLFDRISTRKFKKWRYANGFISRRRKKQIKGFFTYTHMQKMNWREKYPISLLEKLADE